MNNQRDFGTFSLFKEVDKTAIKRTAERFFGNVNVSLVHVSNISTLQVPSAYFITSNGCNAFYSDPDSSEHYCFYPNMLAEYTYRARTVFLGSPPADSFRAAVFVVRPFSGGRGGSADVLGAWSGNSGQYDGCFLFADQVDTLLMANGRFPVRASFTDSSNYVYYGMKVYSAIFAHELGHSFGLIHAKWGASEDDPGDGRTWSNYNHRVYGGHGRCVMLDSLAYNYMTDRDSLYFCSPLDTYSNFGLDCRTNLEWNLPAQP